MNIKRTIIESLVKGMSDDDKTALRAMFAEVEAPEVEAEEGTEVAMADAQLEDGTLIRYEGDTPTEGARVVLVDEEGAEFPAPDGDHTLDSGVVISVSGGVITAVSGAPEEAPAEEAMAADDSRMADLEAKVKQLQDELSGKVEEMAKIDKLEQDIATLVGVVAEFMAQPATDVEAPADVKAPAPSIKELRAAFRSDLRELNRQANGAPQGKMAKKLQKFADMERRGSEERASGPATETALDRRLAELERKFKLAN